MNPRIITNLNHYRKLAARLFAAGTLLATAGSTLAGVRYVNVNSTSPTAPYTNWTTAATTIQNAVDAAVAGDQILVTNGVYQTGGRVVYGSMMNRVAVNKAVTVRSVNGAAVTVIRGFQVPGTITGASAVRCVYLTNGAVLIGFTLTNGATLSQGDYLREGIGGGLWCESADSVVSNCTLSGNLAGYGGGGAYGGTLNNCVLTGNSASYYGGGAYQCRLNSCVLTSNSAYYYGDGGGAYYCTLNNCTLSENSASGAGGGVYGGALNNCTLTANSSWDEGGGADGVTLNNCIVYYNTALNGANYSDCYFRYSCTTPLPLEGVGNTSAEPQLSSASHLSAGSPCRAAGSAAYASGLDIDGETWANPPSIGCDEYHPGAVTGPLSVAIQAPYTTVAVGFTVNFTAAIDGRTTGNLWEFGNGTVVSNQPFTSHSWAAAGDYSVVLHAYNDTDPGGISAAVTVHVVAQPVHFVALNSVIPVAPYTSWATAATNIQQAVDAASAAGALILVTNGLYQTGGRVADEAEALTNRVIVTKPLMVRSVNGAAVTVIDGLGAVRCAYLANGAALAGFTLTNGVAYLGGGVFCASATAVASNCVLAGNWAEGGGGASGGTLNNCTLIGNSTDLLDGGGGGAYLSTLNNCFLTRNVSTYGGGAYLSTLNRCTLTSNSADEGGWRVGGGVADSTLNNCTLTGNAGGWGGGAADGTLNNCTLTGNSALEGGGVAGFCLLNNCIVYYNLAKNGDNYSDGIFSHSCTTPLPPDGVGNITAEPLLTDATHLSAGSPCRGAGRAAFATGLDIDGEPWASPPSIGCDEYHPSAVTGPLSVSIQAAYTNVTVGFAVNFTAATDGHATASRWEFGDGTVVSNRPYAAHGWAAAGAYLVVFRAYNDANPGGVSATVTVQVLAQPVYYVAQGSTNPVVPYASWDTAATDIQDAVDASAAGAVVLVTNGVYQTGGQMVAGTANRVAVTKTVSVRSVNGAAMTVIHGQGAMRCVYLANGANLVGFTLTSGYAYNSIGGGVASAATGGIVSDCVLTGNSSEYGGGAYGSTLNNCTLTGNSASTTGNYPSYGGGASECTLNNCTLTSNFADEGGGTYSSTMSNCTLSGNLSSVGGGASSGTLNNCTLIGNSAGDAGGAYASTLNNCALTGNRGTNSGGGAHSSTLNNCTLTGNSASVGGGACSSGLYNCIVYYNSATNEPNSDHYSYLNYCCTTPLPTNGIANFTNAPAFVDSAHGNLRLQSNSPCINAGYHAYAPAGPDLDGNPRIIGGTVDIGAYEFQLPQSRISYAWLQQYGLPADGSADHTDTDGDGMNNWQEWRAGTNPTNALSALRLLSPIPGASGVIVSWQSVSDRNYFLERGTHLGARLHFLPLAKGIVGQSETTTFTDTNAVGAGPFFYRVGVQD